jgi:hypothetical protein
VGRVFGLGIHEQHDNEEGPMSTDNLFPDEPKPKRRKKLQQRVLEYLREGHTITEEIYKKDFGGSSVSAVLHNLKIRDLYEPGEHIIRDRSLDSSGVWVPSYRLVKEAPVVVEDIPEEKTEIGMFKEDAEDIWEDEEPPVPEYDTPEVSSIVVGVNRHQPELIIMFKGDFKPLRHVMTQMEVRYLMTNLLPFMPKPKE